MKDPLKVRETDQYQNEYVPGFTEKWDQLIDWDRRAESEGDFFIQTLKQHGCRAAVLNISEVENERDRQKNREQGCENRIEVMDGDFTAMPLEDASFDYAWSQDAILHADNRSKVISEVARTVKPEGRPELG